MLNLIVMKQMMKILVKINNLLNKICVKYYLFLIKITSFLEDYKCSLLVESFIYNALLTFFFDSVLLFLNMFIFYPFFLFICLLYVCSFFNLKLFLDFLSKYFFMFFIFLLMTSVSTLLYKVLKYYLWFTFFLFFLKMMFVKSDSSWPFINNLLHFHANMVNKSLLKLAKLYTYIKNLKEH